jgi:hypothetical protein
VNALDQIRDVTDSDIVVGHVCRDDVCGESDELIVFCHFQASCVGGGVGAGRTPEKGLQAPLKVAAPGLGGVLALDVPL